MSQIISPIEVITLSNHRTISWNKLYATRHWTQRQQLAQEIHGIVRATLIDKGYQILSKKHLVNQPVDIDLTASFKDHPIDPDNICAKLYIDGLKDILIRDDTHIYIREVTLRTVIADMNALVIEIFPI